MKSYLVMTLLGPDRPGLVRSLSSAVADHGGNWLESRMARLAGHFAGILRVECPSEMVDPLVATLRGFAKDGLSVQTVLEQDGERGDRRQWRIEVVGNDRPGIVRELTSAIAGTGGNVEELITGLESAAMSGHPIFRARGMVSLPEGADEQTMVSAIEHLGPIWRWKSPDLPALGVDSPGRP
jgi:glycine cleavage system regulatory protein